MIVKGLLPTVCIPTGITSSSSTIIDNLYIKTGPYEYETNILEDDLSDPSLILTTIPLEI